MWLHDSSGTCQFIRPLPDFTKQGLHMRPTHFAGGTSSKYFSCNGQVILWNVQVPSVACPHHSHKCSPMHKGITSSPVEKNSCEIKSGSGLVMRLHPTHKKCQFSKSNECWRPNKQSRQWPFTTVDYWTQWKCLHSTGYSLASCMIHARQAKVCSKYYFIEPRGRAS